MSETTQPPVPESKYAPFSMEDYQIIKQRMGEIGWNLPSHYMNWLWTTCTTLRGKRENQPCSCKSSGALWKRCADDINDWLKRME